MEVAGVGLIMITIIAEFISEMDKLLPSKGKLELELSRLTVTVMLELSEKYQAVALLKTGTLSYLPAWLTPFWIFDESVSGGLHWSSIKCTSGAYTPVSLVLADCTIFGLP